MAGAPYSAPFEKKVAIDLLRSLYYIIDTPYKVIAIDADNTLWQGVCGEQSLAEIIISDENKALQSFLLECEQRGMIICLVSKNIEEDVFNVIDNHPEMHLQRSNIGGYAINWDAKSTNLLELSNKLNIALENFIFIDDSLSQ